jgi:hypothetical protein
MGTLLQTFSQWFYPFVWLLGRIILRKIIVLEHSLWYADFYGISLEQTLNNISIKRMNQHKGELNAG